MKKATILSVSILLVVGFVLLFAYNFVAYGGDEKLAEGSYRTKNFFLLDVKNKTLPKTEYKLKTDFDYPEDSIYKPTNDFELITKNLPRPKYTRDYDPDKKFEPVFLNEYQGEGELEEVWRINYEELIYNLDCFKNAASRVFLFDNILEVNINGNYFEGFRFTYYFDLLTGKGADFNGFKSKISEYQSKNVFSNTTFSPFKNEYLRSDYPKLELLDRFGNIIWRIESYDNPCDLFGVFDMDGNNFFSTKDNGIICTNTQTAETNWILQCSDKKTILDSVYKNGYLWVNTIDMPFGGYLQANNTSRFYRIDLASLEVLELENKDFYSHSSFAFEGSKLAMESKKGTYFFEIETGSEIEVKHKPDSLDTYNRTGYFQNSKLSKWDKDSSRFIGISKPDMTPDWQIDTSNLPTHEKIFASEDITGVYISGESFVACYRKPE